MAIAGFAGGAHAVPTQTTTFIAKLPGTTLAQQPDLAGVVEHDEWVPFTIPDYTSGGSPTKGRIQVRVVRVKAGTLDFYWRIQLEPGGKAPITRFVIGGWPTAVYDANWRIDGLGSVAPSDVFIDLPVSGQLIPLNFALSIGAGKESRFMFLRTKATTYKAYGGSLGDKHLAFGSFAILGPAN